jgi:hypothetical protein
VRRTTPSILTFPLCFIIIASALLLPARAQEPVSAAELIVYTERVKTGFINWGAGYAEVGVEAPYETERFGISHAKMRAIEKAKEQAEKAFYRLLRGINLTGEMRLAGDAELEESLRTLAKKQAKIEKQKTTNVTLTATYRMPIYGSKSLSGVIRGKSFAEGEKGELAGTSGGGYSSVVLDASGTSLQAALLPRIMTEDGKLLFGPADLDAKAAGAVRYVIRGDGGDKQLRLSKATVKNMGENPLVLKVEKVGGEFFADVVLRQDQADALRASKPGDLLAQGKVFIIQTNSIDASGT